MMDYYTSVAHRLNEQRSADLVRETERRRLQAERRSSMDAGEAPARRHGLAAAWSSLRARAHLGHPLPH
jgi:hypothetical protein